MWFILYQIPSLQYFVPGLVSHGIKQAVKLSKGLFTIPADNLVAALTWLVSILEEGNCKNTKNCKLDQHYQPSENNELAVIQQEITWYDNMSYLTVTT